MHSFNLDFRCKNRVTSPLLRHIDTCVGWSPVMEENQSLLKFLFCVWASGLTTTTKNGAWQVLRSTRCAENMGRFAGLKYDQIEANGKPNYMIRALYAAVLVHRLGIVTQIMDIPKSPSRKSVRLFTKKVMDRAKQTTLANLMLRLRLTVTDTDYLTSLIPENGSP